MCDANNTSFAVTLVAITSAIVTAIATLRAANIHARKDKKVAEANANKELLLQKNARRQESVKQLLGQLEDLSLLVLKIAHGYTFSSIVSDWQVADYELFLMRHKENEQLLLKARSIALPMEDLYAKLTQLQADIGALRWWHGPAIEAKAPHKPNAAKISELTQTIIPRATEDILRLIASERERIGRDRLTH